MRARTLIRMHATLLIGVLAAYGVVRASVADDPIRYHVDRDVAQSGDGRTWAEAFQTLQEALDIAGNGDMIWVAEGIYFPTTMLDPPDVRSKTFRIHRRVRICGGFLGNGDPQGGELHLWQRDPEANTTILSGSTDTDERYYHVVYIDNAVDTDAHLSGFTIQSGHADATWGFHEQVGGGVYIEYAGPVISRCVIRLNEAFLEGGGMYIKQGGFQGAPQIISSTITQNEAAMGGGVATSMIAPPDIDTEFINCLFTQNEVIQFGAAYYGALNARVAMTNCTITENAAVPQWSWGGGCGFDISARAKFRNCILWRNSDDGGTMDESSQLSAEHGHTADPDHVSVWYSCIHGLDIFSGDDNIGDDPLFVAPLPPHLGDFRLTGLSPAKDTGDPDPAQVRDDDYDIDDDDDFDEKVPDRDLNRRIVAGEVDMGAYEFFCEGDANDDGQVTVLDLLAVLSAWGPCTGCQADLNRDGEVGVLDLLMVLADWGCPTYTQSPPEGIADCISRYGEDIEKMEACIETIILTEGQ